MRTESSLQFCLAEIPVLAIEAFGSKSKTDAWLSRENTIWGATQYP